MMLASAATVIEKKRRQHHVWQHYLRSWTDGKHLCCLFLRSGKVCRTGPTSVANRKDFYRLREMTPAHINLVEDIIRRSEPPASLHDFTLTMFTKLFELRKRLEREGAFDAEAEARFDVAINNLEEDLHGTMERMAHPLLELLKRRDARIVNDDELYTKLTWFLGVQLTRTTRAANAFSNFPDMDLEPVAGVLRHVLGLNMGYSLFTHRRLSRVTFASTPDDASFITGDFPVVNARELSRSEDPEDLALYYPVSPSRALLIEPRHTHPGVVRERFSRERVLRYNELVASMAVDQVFADNEEELARLWEIRGDAGRDS
jgi:hypothetical protein